ncbi:MAG: Sulfur carrier protein MoaD [Candidatus Accumulibacter sp. BA-94]|uniref:molybdopterin converting factor subunit 1 n=1 Tax=Accumulibacter sp. TaxID=2053492 RepID=UPI00044F02DA|nr:molybdopterin converting factor subunit 1 [Accumulibacter sp.]EXI91540.1 MAG: Sulfur carrier protein MoaD [Candidatus Accumulibacter sp. BA-94]HRD94067.1 molybdopterin converting factor subunit 1 [Accumulibacter sp.]
MIVQILYFAGLRERLGHASEQLEMPDGVTDVAGLLAFLAARGGEWEGLATVRNLRYAVNQEMARPQTTLRAGDEVAFFPPVTGG